MRFGGNAGAPAIADAGLHKNKSLNCGGDLETRPHILHCAGRDHGGVRANAAPDLWRPNAAWLVETVGDLEVA